MTVIIEAITTLIMLFFSINLIESSSFLTYMGGSGSGRKSMIRNKLVMSDFSEAAGVCYSMVQEYTELLKREFPELRKIRKQKFISDLN